MERRSSAKWSDEDEKNRYDRIRQEIVFKKTNFRRTIS
jgi:hypothetical protein